ncbi:keratin, type I cytoskeletal 42-like [Hyla sarda]|uniref:keratin, type I cytoskeletal 42-like n=1 Tax=Hyla sarda TaxID=327740 RepID=UPI0024C28AB8|nr:keratin, type I cytoskeletal 42-like [Hyla sarda]
MSCRGRKAWSSAGSLKGIYNYGGDPKKLSRHVYLPNHDGFPRTFNVYGGASVRKTAQDSRNFGKTAQDSRNFGKTAQDSRNFGKTAQDSRNFGKTAQDSRNFGKTAQDSRNFGKTAHNSRDFVFGSGSVHTGYSLNNGFESRRGWNEGLFSMNSKDTMKLLNERLANYLGQVAKLEEENIQLERKIQEWHKKNTPKEQPNFSNYFTTIQELQKKISDAALENCQIVLHIDNARLAGEDLGNKYNMELSVRNNIEADLQVLRKGLDDLTMEKHDLNLQLEFLTEDLASLKKNHNEEVNSLRSQLGARVNVEINAAPSADISKILLEIRTEYERLMDQNMKEVEKWFMTQREELNSQMTSETEHLQSVKMEVIELRHTVQMLEIELQTELSKKLALEGSLTEVKEDYGRQLTSIQDSIHKVEAELSGLRYDLERQNHEYKILMDVRTRLEMEIATYQRLLQEEDIVPRAKTVIQRGSRRGLKVVSITEDYEDGVFVSKHEQIRHL